MKRAARIDENHTDIVAALVKAGCSVQSLAAIGLGCPDILCGFKGQNLLLEFKNPDSAKGRAGLNEDQKKWHKFWKGHVATVYTPAEALKAVADAFLGFPGSEPVQSGVSEQPADGGW